MFRFRKYFIFLLFISCANLLLAQSDSVIVKGKVTDKDNPYVWIPCMAINKTTGKGIFGDNGGRFTIKMKKSDTLIVSATGYIQQKFCFKDSIQRTYSINVELQKKPIELKPVEVKPERELVIIEDELKTLKKEEVNKVTGIYVIQSPITALYERFSKIGKQKNLVAEMEYEDKRKDLMKELLSKYVRYDIIDLKDDEFDAFIDFLALPDEFIQHAEQYDLIMAIKYRYEVFEARRR
jgi:hypothetical protein